MVSAESLDSVLSYVDAANTDKMAFQKPGRVVAYELTSWDGKGPSPPVVSTPGFVPPSLVGRDVLEFAKIRAELKDKAWRLTNVWIVHAPLREADVMA